MIPILAAAGGMLLGEAKANLPGLMVKVGRASFVTTAGVIGLATYTGWRNQRVAEGSGKFPIPGIHKGKATGSVSRSAQEVIAQNPQGASSGSIAELYWPDYDPVGGHDGHLHLAITDKGALNAIARFIADMGYVVSEHPNWGGVHAVHSENSYHYKGQAIDVNWRKDGNERQKLNVLAAWIRDNAHRYVKDPTKGGKAIAY